MNRSDPTLTLFYGLHSSLQFVLLKFGIDISDSLKTIRHLETLRDLIRPIMLINLLSIRLFPNLGYADLPPPLFAI